VALWKQNILQRGNFSKAYIANQFPFYKFKTIFKQKSIQTIAINTFRDLSFNKKQLLSTIISPFWMAFTNGQVIGRSSRTVQPNSQVVGRYGQKTQPYSQVIGRSSQTVQPCGQAIGRYGQVTQPRSQVVGRYSCVYRNSLFKDHLFVMRMIWQYPERDARLFCTSTYDL